MVEFGGWVSGLLLSIVVIIIVCIAYLVAYKKGRIAGFKDGAKYVSDEIRKTFDNASDDE